MITDIDYFYDTIRNLDEKSFHIAVDNRLRTVQNAFASTYRVTLIKRRSGIKWPWKEEAHLLWKEYAKAPRRWLASGKERPSYHPYKTWFPEPGKRYKFMDHPSEWLATDYPKSKFFVWVPYGTWDFEYLEEFSKCARATVALLPKQFSFRYFRLSTPLVAFRKEDPGMAERFGDLPEARADAISLDY